MNRIKSRKEVQLLSTFEQNLSKTSSSFCVLQPPTVKDIMKDFRLIVIVLMSLLALGTFTEGSPADDKTKVDSVNQEMPFFSPEIDASDPSSTASRFRRSNREHHHGFIAGAATGAVVANHHQPNYYAPTYYYPPAYYPPPNYYDNGYNYYY